MNDALEISQEIVLAECERLGITSRQLRRMRESGLVNARPIGLGRGKGRTMIYSSSTIRRLSRIQALRKQRRNDKWILYWLWRDGENVEIEQIRLFLISIVVFPVSLIERLDFMSGMVPAMISLAKGKPGVIYPYQHEETDTTESEELASHELVRSFRQYLSIEGISEDKISDDLMRADEAKLFASRTFRNVLRHVDQSVLARVNQSIPPKEISNLFDSELAPRLAAVPMIPKQTIQKLEDIADPLLLSFFITLINSINCGHIEVSYLV